MIARIKPSSIGGVVTAPPSKSMAHRLLICAGLADGESIIHNVADSDDIRATIGCLRALGAEITPQGTDMHVRGADVRARDAEAPSPRHTVFL